MKGDLWVSGRCNATLNQHGLVFLHVTSFLLLRSVSDLLYSDGVGHLTCERTSSSALPAQVTETHLCWSHGVRLGVPGGPGHVRHAHTKWVVLWEGGGCASVCAAGGCSLVDFQVSVHHLSIYFYFYCSVTQTSAVYSSQHENRLIALCLSHLRGVMSHHCTCACQSYWSLNEGNSLIGVSLRRTAYKEMKESKPNDLYIIYKSVFFIYCSCKSQQQPSRGALCCEDQRKQRLEKQGGGRRAVEESQALITTND